MRRNLRLVLALVFVAGYALADDIRNRRPDEHWIPGWLEGDYSATAVVNLLPDVIEATLEYLTGPRTIDDLTGARTIGNLTPVRTLEKL